MKIISSLNITPKIIYDDYLDSVVTINFNLALKQREVMKKYGLGKRDSDNDFNKLGNLMVWLESLPKQTLNKIYIEINFK